MPDAKTAAILRAVLEELCANLPRDDAGTRTNVASQLLETVRRGRCSIDELRAAGREALPSTPTMWR